MDDVIAVTIVECTANLTRKFACDTFAESTVADDVVEHLTATHVLEDHIIMMLMDDHFAHAADVWMVKKHGEGGFADGSDFLGGVFGGLLCEGLRRGVRAIWEGVGGVHAGEDLYSELEGKNNERE